MAETRSKARIKAEEDAALADAQLAATEADSKLPVEDRAKPVKGSTDLKVKVRDKEFKVQRDAPIFVLMEWAAADDNTQSLVAVYHVLKEIVAVDEWPAFAAFARTLRDKDALKDLIDFQNRAFEAISGNPTEPPANS
jgi:hypothetical protein